MEAKPLTWIGTWRYQSLESGGSIVHSYEEPLTERDDGVITFHEGHSAGVGLLLDLHDLPD